MKSHKMSLDVSTAETVMYQRIPVGLLQQIVDFLNARKYHSRTDAVNDLLSIGLTTVNNLDKIQDPELVAELRAQIHEAGLVHYVQSLNPHQIEVLWSIIDNEMNSRDHQWRSRLMKKEKK